MTVILKIEAAPPLNARLDPIPLVDPVRRFILFTNPKCGGTTLKDWFFHNVGFRTLHRRPAHLMLSFGPRFLRAHLQHGRHLAADVMRPQEETEEYKAALRKFTHFYRAAYCTRFLATGCGADFFRICVVRNPYDRIVSAFLDKLCGEGRFGREAPYVRAMLQELGRSEISFREFLVHLRGSDPASTATHWRRQTYLIEGERIDAFVRLEHLHAEMERLAPIIGDDHLALLGARLQSTRSADIIAAEDLTDMPNLAIVAHREATGLYPPRRALLTDETRALIREIYAADFERLPYEA